MKQMLHIQWHGLFLRVFAVVVLGAAVFHASPAHGATDAGARVVKYSKEDIVPVRAKLRFSTLIVLPEDEEILRSIAGATPAEWKLAWRYVEPKFPQVEGGRRNARLEYRDALRPEAGAP